MQYSNEKITSGTKIYLGYTASVPMEKISLTEKTKAFSGKNMREEKTKTEVYRNIPTD